MRDEATQHAAVLSRLLRFLSNGPARIVAGTENEAVDLARANENGRRFSHASVQLALSRGMIRRRGSELHLDAGGRDWLKRASCAGDPFAAQHGERGVAVMEVEGGRQAATVNLDESPLAVLRRLKAKDGRPFLDAHLFEAGERLRSDFTRAQMQPRISANWEAGVGSSGRRAINGIADLSDASLAARLRVEKALTTVGPELSGVLVDVCCFLKGLETVERERQWPVRSAKLMLKTALSALDRHYRPQAGETTPDGVRRAHRWGVDGYKPSLRRS